MKGHWLACACDILGISNVDGAIKVPPNLNKASAAEQRMFLEGFSKKVVERMSLVDSTFVTNDGNEVNMATNNTVYNYARTLCQYGSLVVDRSFGMLGLREMVTECCGARNCSCLISTLLAVTNMPLKPSDSSSRLALFWFQI